MTPDDLKDIPDGTLIALRVEGRLDRSKDKNSLDTCVVMLNDRIRLLYIEGETAALLRMATSIEVLPEPVVEPTRRLAMVVDRDGLPWVRRDEWSPPRWQATGSSLYPWLWVDLAKAVGPLTVVFEGLENDNG